MDKYNEISNMIYYNNDKLRYKKFDLKKYKQAVSSLLYQLIDIRPDIMLTTYKKVFRKNKDPTYEN